MQAAGKRTSSVSNSLIAVLKDEMKYERESYRREEVLLSEPPNGFELQDARGTTVFMLGKQFGSEEIVVRANIDNQPDMDEGEDDEYEDEDEEELPVEFQVLITKSGSNEAMLFECESDGEYLTILRVSLDRLASSSGPGLLGIGDDDDDDDPGPLAYRGPVFENLDDTLQQAFVDFLEERGVTASLGEYIRLYVEDKSSLEYQQWLGRVRDFIAR